MIASRMVGKNVIVIVKKELTIGTLVLADETGVELENARRLHLKYLQHYESLLKSGIATDFRFSDIVGTKVIISNNYSIILIPDEIHAEIMRAETMKQTPDYIISV